MDPLDAVSRSQAIGTTPAAPAASTPAAKPASGEFAEALKFSSHALKRLEQRGIELDVDRLEQAMDKAEAKGGRDSLILMDDLALIVSIKNRTVVTALDASRQKEGVFTNIDSVVIG